MNWYSGGLDVDATMFPGGLLPTGLLDVNGRLSFGDVIGGDEEPTGLGVLSYNSN